jgi:hypothetical protein
MQPDRKNNIKNPVIKNSDFKIETRNISTRPVKQ